ncbi:MAG: hypothetical protein MUP80_06505, partial [Acidobacteriia bacterium]|nr:hypothetical protein [Terriglobia bacterium]
NQFHDRFDSYPKILVRVLRTVLHTRTPTKVLLGLITNLTCRYNHLLDRKVDALRCAPPDTASPKHGLRPQED